MDKRALANGAEIEWGFFGAMINAGKDAPVLFDYAARMIAARTDASEEAARLFLDSKYGRHFGDEVRNELLRNNAKEAIDAAIDAWQRQSIQKHTERNYGIPAGMPYLTGWVHFYAIQEKLS